MTCKRTVLGMGWSMLSPLLILLVMKLVFGRFFVKTVCSSGSPG